MYAASSGMICLAPHARTQSGASIMHRTRSCSRSLLTSPCSQSYLHRVYLFLRATGFLCASRVLKIPREATPRSQIVTLCAISHWTKPVRHGP